LLPIYAAGMTDARAVLAVMVALAERDAPVHGMEPGTRGRRSTLLLLCTDGLAELGRDDVAFWSGRSCRGFNSAPREPPALSTISSMPRAMTPRVPPATT
jgi:hypothetical protein